MTEKSRMHLHIDSDLQVKFRRLIQLKYHRYEKGLLSYEVEMALTHWLAIHTNTQSIAATNKPNPTPRVFMAFAKIKNFLLSPSESGYLYEDLRNGTQIPRIHIVRAIENTMGSDKRTINKWLTIFEKNGLIKPVTSTVWEIL